MIESDVKINVSKLQPEAVPQSMHEFNNHLTKIMESNPKWWEVGAAKYRQMRVEGKTALPGRMTLEGGKNTTIPSRDSGREIPCRIFRPEHGNVKGVFMHIHGGGWAMGSHEDFDLLLKTMANGADLAVISVGYRLAPEDPFPAGPHDCYDAAEWLVDNAESEFSAPLRFISGESAGGHLSVLSALHLLKTRPSHHLSGLVLHYGAFDLSNLPSVQNFHTELILSTEIMQHFYDAFLPGVTGEQRKSPEVSPFYADLTGLKLPPALFTCGTADPLLDDSIMMGIKWQAAGAEAIVKLYPGAPHAFNGFPPDKVPAAKECNETTLQFIKEKLGS